MASDAIAVTETLDRLAAGIALKNRSVLASAFAYDAISDFRPTAATIGFDHPVLTGPRHDRRCVVGLAERDLHDPFRMPPRVSVDGDNAHLDALVEAQHLPSADHSRHYLMQNRYDVGLVRRGDAWVIQRLTIDNVWRTGDPSVLAGV